MDYNSSRNHLVFKEYGRNIQRMVEFAIGIEDDVKRQKAVGEIINIMGQTNPHLRNIDDFKHKLWDHLFIMSDFKLKAESPYPLPIPGLVNENKPGDVKYPSSKMRFRHYGRNIERMIEKAIDVEDDEKRMAFVKIIGSYMKMVYRNYNRENVSDEIIINDIRILSKGKIDITEKMRFDLLASSQNQKRSSSHGHSSSGGYKKRRSGKGGSYGGGHSNRGGSGSKHSKYKKRPRR